MCDCVCVCVRACAIIVLVSLPEAAGGMCTVGMGTGKALEGCVSCTPSNRTLLASRSEPAGVCVCGGGGSFALYVHANVCVEMCGDGRDGCRLQTYIRLELGGSGSIATQPASQGHH